MAAAGEHVKLVDAHALVVAPVGDWTPRTELRAALVPGYYIVLRAERRTSCAIDFCPTWFGPFRFAVQARAVFDRYLRRYAAEADAPCVAYLVQRDRNEH